MGEHTNTPKMAKLYFVSDGNEPAKLWAKCKKVQHDWCKEKLKPELVVKDVFKELAVNYVYESNKLEDTLPKETDEIEVKLLLAKFYDDELNDTQLLRVDLPTGGRQLLQHLKAFKLLCENRRESNTLPDLTESLIQQVHSIMMRGLKTEQGEEISAGFYRKISVHAGQHVYPSYECIPVNMGKIVAEYSRKASQPHDMYQLASWLHFKIVSLHPFEDGNGRLSRLLWCYSLMRDGLPFPAVLTSGHKRSQTHLVRCLERDRKYIVSDHPHLTTLTVVSVYQAWEAWNDSISSITQTLPCTYV